MTIYETQALLDLLGYNPDKDQPARIRRTFVDGIDGPKTRAALDAFEADYGCREDGLIGALAGTVVKVDRSSFDELIEDALPDPELPANFAGIKYFRPEEFRCKCGGKYCNGHTAEMDHKLLTILDRVRDYFNAPVIITSGIRCEQHNRNVGGVYNSRHRTGHAADIVVRGFSSAMVDAYVGSIVGVNYHYCIDGSAVHVDTI